MTIGLAGRPSFDNSCYARCYQRDKKNVCLWNLCFPFLRQNKIFCSPAQSVMTFVIVSILINLVNELSYRCFEHLAIERTKPTTLIIINRRFVINNTRTYFSFKSVTLASLVTGPVHLSNDLKKNFFLISRL